MTIEKVGRAMTWSLVARIAAFAAGFAANVLIVRSLGEHDWGILSEIKTILQFVLVLIMVGADTAILKFVPMLRVGGGAKSFLGTFRWVILIQTGVWLCILVGSRFGGNYLNGFFRDQSDRLGIYLQVAVGFLIFEILMILVTNFFQSWYETKRLAAVMVCGNVVYFGAVAFALQRGFGIVGILAASAVTNLLMVAVLVPQARGFVGSVPSSGAGPGVGEVLRFSLPFVVTGLLNQIVWRQSEVLFLGHFGGAEAAGFFGLAYRTPQLLLEFVPISIWPIVMAGTSETYAKDPRDLPRAISLYFKLIYLLVVPIAAMGFAFARPLVPLIYGSQMIPAALLTQLFFVVFSYSFLYTPMSMALYVMGKSWVNMLIFLSLAIVEVGLDLALIPRYGLWGAMVPVSVVLMLAVILFNSAVKRLMPDVKMPVGFIVRCSVAALPTCLLSLLSSRWSSPVSLLVLIPAGIVLLVMGFRVMRVIGDEERALIRKLPIPAKERILSIL
ncbi:MAG: oligosaccharide flippase family protein [Candidatus Krumholzibacteria bacterium]|nr:oligosaccharide flippase family protein [Candidatus Krumholzibacteria bacterium]